MESMDNVNCSFVFILLQVYPFSVQLKLSVRSVEGSVTKVLIICSFVPDKVFILVSNYQQARSIGISALSLLIPVG